MIWRDAIRQAISGLRGGIVRTVLTILGLGVGVGAVLAVLALGSAGEERVEQEIARLGVDKVWIRSKDGTHTLTAEDSALLFQAADAPACAGAYTVASITVGGSTTLTQIAGYDASIVSVHAPKLLEGRLFVPSDYVGQGSAVCLIDEAFADRLDDEAVGQRITVGNRRFLIVGVIKGMTMQAMSAGSGLVILPLNSFLSTFGGDVAEITLAVQQGQKTENVASQALNALSDKEGYRAETLENEIDAAREVIRIFVMVLMCVSLVCMLTGGIGVMNILLVSVRERRREIGLIKAVGGTSGQVGLLFLLEAVAYAISGGLLGVLLGAVMIRVFGAWIGLDAQLELLSTLPVLLGAACLGAIFGVFPALKAAALTPVDALRSD